MYLTAQPNTPCMKPALFPAFARTKTRKPYSTRSAISREEMSEHIVMLIFFCEGVSHDEIDHLRATHILEVKYRKSSVMYPAATIASPHRRSCWAGTEKGKGVVILTLKRGEPRLGAATGVMPHGGSAAGEGRKTPAGPLMP